MKIFRITAKRIRGLSSMYSNVLQHYTELRLRLLGTERVFNEIFVKNKWSDTESVSGPGSHS